MSKVSPFPSSNGGGGGGYNNLKEFTRYREFPQYFNRFKLALFFYWTILVDIRKFTRRSSLCVCVCHCLFFLISLEISLWFAFVSDRWLLLLLFIYNWCVIVVLYEHISLSIEKILKILLLGLASANVPWPFCSLIRWPGDWPVSVFKGKFYVQDYCKRCLALAKRVTQNRLGRYTHTYICSLYYDVKNS